MDVLAISLSFSPSPGPLLTFSTHGSERIWYHTLAFSQRKDTGPQSTHGYSQYTTRRTLRDKAAQMRHKRVSLLNDNIHLFNFVVLHAKEE